LKRRDLERHLLAHGVRLLRQGGNHGFWGFDAYRSTAAPRHREIDFGLVRKICRDLQIPAATTPPSCAAHA
jgi:predicted RNA binding protein YcfA (HicA-like mRNA interferase family)